jgi:hypothetical protein
VLPEFEHKKDHEKSSGNIFADLGFPNSGQKLVKAKLTVQIYKLLKERGLTQGEAASSRSSTYWQYAYVGSSLPPQYHL